MAVKACEPDGCKASRRQIGRESKLKILSFARKVLMFARMRRVNRVAHRHDHSASKLVLVAVVTGLIASSAGIAETPDPNVPIPDNAALEAAVAKQVEIPANVQK